MKAFLLFILFIGLFSYEISIVNNEKIDNGKTGIKLALSGKTVQYVAQQMIPFFKKQIQGMQMPDLHQDEHTPIGKISLDVTSFQLRSFDLSTPVITIVAGNEFLFQDSHISASLHANWHYKDHAFPYVSDSGSFDLNIDVSVSIKTGAQVDPSYASGVKILCGDFQLGFNSFNLNMHGGASWLYNLLIGALKGTIEDTIRNEVKKQVPPMVVEQAQEALDKVDLNIEVFDDVFFSFVIDDLIFDTSKNFLGVGVDGDFYKKDIVYPGTPCELPDIVSSDSMISIFISEYTANSAGYVFAKAGVFSYTLTNDDIPSQWPIKLNTSWFKALIPNLWKMFPDQEMQITFESDLENTPAITFKSDTFMTLSADMEMMFQVIDANKSIENAFTLDLKLVANGSVAVTEKEGQYFISGSVGYQNMEISLKQTIIGQFDVKLLQQSVKFLMDNVMLPLLNKMLNDGIPLPAIQFFTLTNPQVLYHDGYIEVRSDFTFTPPGTL